MARDFEAMADSSILQAVVQASANRNVTAKEFSPTANGSNLSPSLDSTPIDANVECTDVLSIKKTCSVSPNPEDSIK